MPLAAEVARFVQALEAGVAAVDPSTTPSPPGSSAEGAGKGLRKLCEVPAEHDGFAGATKALCASPHIARVLCATVASCTAAIDAIDANKQLDLATSGLVSWGHLRANALAVLLHMASSEERCGELLGSAEQEPPGSNIAATCAAVLSSAASRTDLEGVRVTAQASHSVMHSGPAWASHGLAWGTLCHITRHEPEEPARVPLASPADLAVL